MAMTYANVDGRVTYQGNDIGIRARVIVTPMTTQSALLFPSENRITWGPQTAETNNTGTLADLKIPTNHGLSELYWRIEIEPLDTIPGLPKRWTMGTYEITEDVRLEDLVQIDVTTVNSGLLVTVAELLADAEAARDDAQTAQTAAAGSATDAAGSATTATTKAGEASTSATAAAGSATAAAGSATAAAGSATAAAASADHAEDMAGAAEAVAVSNDSIIAGRIGDSESLTSAALSASYVEEGAAFADLGKQAGVDPTGVSACGSAIQTALDSFASLGVRAYAKGTFNIGTTTVKITGNADLGDATFNYSGSTVAVQIGDGSSGVLLRWKDITLPHIVNTGKSGTGWSSGTIGVKAVNTQECDIYAPEIKGFETGYYAYGLGGGNVYNDIRFRHLNNNKRNLVIGAGSGGWANSNTYRLGSLSHESAEGTNVSGVRQILIDTATNQVNGNLFLGGSVEGSTAEYHLDCDGADNIFHDIRWEVSGGARVIWRANAARNVVQYGYAAQSVVETHTAGSTLNQIYTTGRTWLSGSTAKATLVLENTSSAASAADAVMDPGARVAGSDPLTAYRVYRTANSTKMKRAADTADRLILDHDNGRIYFGAGSTAPTRYLQPGNGGPSADSVSKLIGPYGLQAGAFATGSRPSASTQGIGTMIFDSTLGKPIWSNGSAWVDATGTTV